MNRKKIIFSILTIVIILRCAVDEPVAALNQEQQTDDKK